MNICIRYNLHQMTLFNADVYGLQLYMVVYRFHTAVLKILCYVNPVESSQKTSSHEIPKLSEDLKTKQRRLEDIESGDRGLAKLWSNLTEMNRKVNFSMWWMFLMKASR